MSVFSTKHVLVTGATSGIGLGIASAFAQKGAQITALGLGDTDKINKQLSALNPRSIAIECDLADPLSRQSVLDSLPPVDVAINNAGIQYVSPVEDFPPEKWEQIIALNLSASFYVMQAVIPGMKAKGWGRIVNIASAHGLVASPFKSAYIAAKHGIIGLTKTAALELAESGITVNAICPGYVRTPLVEGQIEDQARVHGLEREDVIHNIMLTPQPTKRFVEIDEVADYTVFVCGESAGSITGAELKIDGGWTAR